MGGETGQSGLIKLKSNCYRMHLELSPYIHRTFTAHSPNSHADNGSLGRRPLAQT